MSKGKKFSSLAKVLTKEAILDLQWWMKNLYTVSKKLQYLDITKVIYTDTSMHGWGAYCDGMSTGGSWINTEKNWLAYKCSRIKIHSFN